MRPRYRLLHYITRPVIGTRIPIGAIVESGGALRLIRAARLPDETSLGSPALANAVQHALSDTDQPNTFDELPPAVGPQVVMGPPAMMPEGIADPFRWVAEHLLPA